MVGTLCAYLAAPAILATKRLFQSPPTYKVGDHQYTVLWSLVNRTWRNERAAELPIALSLLDGFSPDRVLEVGNVLSWYGRVGHLIVDKYERGGNVLNVDVVDIDLPRSFDLILSVSTLEHVGWDEKPRDPDKLVRALAAMRRHLSSDGTLFVTLPVGWNPNVNRLLEEGRLDFDELRYLKRVSRASDWLETDWTEVRDCRYGDPYPGAGAIILAWNHGSGSDSG